eukprot:gene3791-4372_t
MMLIFRAQDWDPSTYIWSGRLVIVARGELCTIKFEDPANGEIFAQCPVDQTSVEPVTDSSRYFVIKIKDGDRHALVGMGFTDRSDAFDFNATLQDHQNYCRNKKESAMARQNFDNAPKKDYSLKTGQTIHIPFKAPTSGTSPSPSRPAAVLTGVSSGGGFLLSPPPPSGNKSYAPKMMHNIGEIFKPEEPPLKRTGDKCGLACCVIISFKITAIVAGGVFSILLFVFTWRRNRARKNKDIATLQEQQKKTQLYDLFEREEEKKDQKKEKDLEMQPIEEA